MEAYQLSHAYLFYGADREKLIFHAAESIAKAENIPNEHLAVLRERIRLASHPDILVIEKNEGAIKVDTIRAIYDFVMLSPSEFDRRIVIIRDADNLSEIVQNALLKILEEPPTECMFYILAASPDSFLPTVLSRLAKINFADGSTLKSLSDEQGWYIREILPEIVISGNIEKLLDAAKKISTSETPLKNYLENMYEYFSAIACKKAEENNMFVLMTDPVSAVSFAHKCTKIIRDALIDIENNASAQLLAESVFINILEEYNAENRRN